MEETVQQQQYNNHDGEESVVSPAIEGKKEKREDSKGVDGQRERKSFERRPRQADATSSFVGPEARRGGY